MGSEYLARIKSVVFFAALRPIQLKANLDVTFKCSQDQNW